MLAAIIIFIITIAIMIALPFTDGWSTFAENVHIPTLCWVEKSWMRKKNVGDGKGGRCLDHLVGFYITVTISSSIWNVHSGPRISCWALLPVALVFRILGTELNCFWQLELSPWSQQVTPEVDGHFRNCGQQAGGHLDIREDLGGMVVNVPTFFYTYLFIWLILVVASRIFCCSM